MFMKIIIILLITFQFGYPKPSLKGEDAKLRTKRNSQCPKFNKVLFNFAKNVNKHVHKDVKVKAGQHAEMRRSTDIEVTDCCEVRDILVESECRMLEQHHVTNKKQLLISFQQLKYKLDAFIASQHTESHKSELRNRRKPKYSKQLLRTFAPGKYHSYISQTKSKCKHIVTDKSLSSVAYSEYFVQLFSSCKSCKFSRMC